MRLRDLLDFSDVTTFDGVGIRFEEIAKQIIHGHILVVATGATHLEFEVLELEFYLIVPGIHEDPFTHGSNEQAHSGRWYFHRAPRRATDNTADPPPPSTTAAGGYRGGTRKGLDLTIGGPLTSMTTSRFFTTPPSASSKPIRGGVLLRTIRRVCDGMVISGPSLLVDEILRSNKASSISELVDKRWGGETSALLSQADSAGSSTGSTSSYRMYFRPKSSTKLETMPQIYTSPRIGLDLSQVQTTSSLSDYPSHPRVKFVSLPYRYFIHPALLTSNGRGHTFLAVYRCYLSRLELSDPVQRLDSNIVEEIAKTAGLKEETVQKYAAEYYTGYTDGKLGSYIGKAGKGAASSPVGFLRLMGVLRRIKECPPHA
ncbi:hypothetical protein K474DRAFT_1597086 [Panus rudis PR-1116 ss-1]|nr:hypothetical protein K474DRAFT_1597086 [Panus rudis PR-1116 ss-1]